MKAKINGNGKRKDDKENPLVGLKRSIAHLTSAIEETEASRQGQHDAGLQCWVDSLITKSDV